MMFSYMMFSYNEVMIYTIGLVVAFGLGVIGYHYLVNGAKIQARPVKCELLQEGAMVYTYQVLVSAPNVLLPALLKCLPTRKAITNVNEKKGPCPILMIVGKMHSFAFERNSTVAKIAETFNVVKHLFGFRWWPELHHIGNMSTQMWLWNVYASVKEITALYCHVDQMERIDWTAREFNWENGLASCMHCGLFDNQVATTEQDRLLHLLMDCNEYRDYVLEI